MGQGWVKIHRTILDSKTFSRLTAIQKLIAIYIILNANHKDGIWYDKYKNIEVPVKRGQLIVSRKTIIEEWFSNDKDVTDRKLRTALDKLEKFNFLTKHSTNNYTLLTVVNYDIYQSSIEESDQDNDHETTMRRPRNDHETTLNKNDNNDKNAEEVCSSNSPDPFQYFQKNISSINPSIQKLITDWLQKDNLSPYLICKAINIATEKDNRTMAYIQGIIKNWKKDGITTLEDAEAAEAMFKGHKSRYEKPKKETINDWK